MSNSQRVLHTLAATQEVPRHTRLHSRGSTRVPPTSRGAPFLPPSSKGLILSLRGRERIPGVPVASQDESLSTGKARGPPGSCHHSRVPQMSQSIPGKPVFPALLRLSSRGSTHTTVSRGTALWESLVGKPTGKASRESNRSLNPRKGKRGTAATARENSHEHALTGDEDCLPWGDSRSTPRSMSALERNPQVPALTPHKVLGPGIDVRGIPRGLRATRMGTGLS